MDVTGSIIDFSAREFSRLICMNRSVSYIKFLWAGSNLRHFHQPQRFIYIGLLNLKQKRLNVSRIHAIQYLLHRSSVGVQLLQIDEELIIEFEQLNNPYKKN